MPHPLSLAYLTTVPHDAEDALRLAASLGCGCIGVRLAPAMPGGAFTPLVADRARRSAVKALMRDTGVAVVDVEIVRIGAAFDVAAWEPFLDCGAELGARHILIAGDDPDEARLTSSFAAFCEAAAKRSMTADLEFMAWTKIPDARAALRIASKAGVSNAGVLIDAFHVVNSATTLDDLRAIPRAMLHYVQLCDVAHTPPTSEADVIRMARGERLLMGHGRVPWHELLTVIPDDVPISLEIPNDVEKARGGISDWARQALQTARSTLHAAGRAVT